MSIQDRFTRHTYSYMALRKAVGFIGILLPFMLIAGAYFIFCEEITQSSISHYYYTGMRDVFVGSLCAVALFMFFYSGYDRRDDWAGHIAGLFALGVAWFPTTEVGPSDLVGKVHYFSAAAFFLTLCYFSLFLFTQTKEGVEPTPEKIIRNRIYRTCGIIMLTCIAAIAIYQVFFHNENSRSFVVFVGETIALVAFGISWLTKGEAVYGDKAE